MAAMVREGRFPKKNSLNSRSSNLKYPDMVVLPSRMKLEDKEIMMTFLRNTMPAK